jgi:hypothetical protein
MCAVCCDLGSGHTAIRGGPTGTLERLRHLLNHAPLRSRSSGSRVLEALTQAAAQISTARVATYLHCDQLGSIRLLTNAAGASAGTATYTAYGTRTTTGTSSASVDEVEDADLFALVIAVGVLTQRTTTVRAA